jgi:ubiquinone/menaquinone biosynthesis C-methylase UbiE
MEHHIMGWSWDKGRYKTGAKILHSQLIKVLKDKGIKVENYLDIGCGEGTVTALIANAVKAKRVVGVDPSGNFLQTFADNVKAEYLENLKLDLDRDALPFPDNSFDLVSMIEIIEHLLNPDNMLGEVRRVLKPDGYFLVSMPSLGNWYNRLLLLFGFQPAHTDPSGKYWAGMPAKVKIKGGHHGHYSPYTFRALVEILRYYGFKIVSKRGFSLPCRYKIVDSINRFFQRFPSLADGMIILAKKKTDGSPRISKP